MFRPYLRFTHAIFVCVITVYKLHAISYLLFMQTVVSLYPQYVSPISQDIKLHIIVDVKHHVCLLALDEE